VDDYNMAIELPAARMRIHGGAPDLGRGSQGMDHCLHGLLFQRAISVVGGDEGLHLLFSAWPCHAIRDVNNSVREACDLFHFWSWHHGGAHFLYADGSVHFLTYGADAVLQALGTRAGSEVVTVLERQAAQAY
jgi:prepilin-type processing-associated H-X9-DG protein